MKKLPLFGRDTKPLFRSMTRLDCAAWDNPFHNDRYRHQSALLLFPSNLCFLDPVRDNEYNYRRSGA